MSREPFKSAYCTENEKLEQIFCDSPIARPKSANLGKKKGTGISASENGVRTNRISYTKTTVPLGKADRAPELHLGYLHDLETRRWDNADLAFGGIARLDSGARMAAARVALNLRFRMEIT